MGMPHNLFILQHLLPFAGDCKLSCLDSLYVGSKTMVALSLMELPGNTGHLILAMGGLDNKIHLYCGERTGKVILHLTSLWL